MSPVTIDIISSTDTQSIEWYIPVDEITPGSYELVLGISSRHLDLNAVDSIAFDYFYGADQVSNRPSEVMPNTTLHDLFVTPKAGDSDYSTTTGLGENSHSDFSMDTRIILRWKLYEHIAVKLGAGGMIKVAMSIEVWKGVSTEPGTIGLHFLELHQDSFEVYRDVVLDLTDQTFSTSYVRQHHQDGIQNFTTTTSGLPEEQYVAQELHGDLRHYRGRGTFCVSGNLDRTLKDERFIAFDGITVVEYSICGKWEEVDRVTIGRPEDLIDLYPYWKGHLRRDHLLLLNKERAYVSIWNLKKKRSVTAMDIPTTTSDNPYIAACLSGCGGRFVMATMRRVDVYLTDTWTRLGSWILPTAEQNNISDVDFMNGSEYITIDTSSDLGAAIRSHGYVVDIHTMTTVNRVLSRNLRPNSFSTLDSADRSASMLLYQSQTILGAIRYSDRLVRPLSKVTTFCTDECTSGLFFQPPSPSIFQAEVVEGTLESEDKLKSMRYISITAKSTVDTTVDVMSLPLPKGTEFLGLSWSLVGGHYILVMTITALMIVWRIPATLHDNYELILAEGSTVDSNWSVCQHQQLRQHDRGKNIVTTRNLLDPCIRDSGAFLDGIVQLSRIFRDADDKSKSGIICYVERHINHCLGTEDNAATALSRLCASWTPESHEHLLVLTRELFESPTFRWIPTAGLSRQSNPISILLKHLDSSVVVIDIAEIMIGYCVCEANADSDLRFLDPVFLSLRAAVKSKYITSGLLSRTMRSFAYFPARDYHFVMDHHGFALPIFKYRERKKMLHERKHPTLYLTSKNASKTSNKRLTPHLYVASFDMLWVIEEIPFPKQKSLAIALRLLLLVTLTSRKRTQFGYVYWIYRIIFYCYIAWFFVALIFTTLISDRDDEPVSSIYNANICLSWIFALVSARDLVLLTCLKMKPRDFMYKVVEILVAFVPSIALMSVAFSLDLDLFYFVTSLSILVLLLQLYLACEGDKCPKLPDDNSAAFLTITSTYFMTGGMYGLVDEQIKTGNWILHVIMVTFLFTVTIMLNILFGMVNHTFSKHDRTPELEWMEDRMVFVTRAENTFRSIPFLRKNVAWFPEKIYYTATPQEVRDYRLESQRLAKTAVAAALPLEDEIQETTIDTYAPTEIAVTAEHQASERQHNWVDQLKEDMKAEFKEELREQLEAQKRQSDAQIEQLQAQLSEILAVLRAGPKGT
ncbi:hypothetical protein BGZ96_012377 [Linnemannia gamsii]|uniref:Ion transport domain-containing protein n=1 Tax=Linnemannia gamsii TaxID=64522 RepID=A0ABQ7KBI9_9FUNG|nr:hypothetical protein BGZ96_012377 [Linnemannia gamsii]